MTRFPVDTLVFTPADVDLTRSPLAAGMARAGVETYVLGAFNPGLTRLPGGNLLMMVRVAEALRTPILDGHVHSIRWDEDKGYVVDAWPLELADTADPRLFTLHGGGWKIQALTSLSWLLPVELSPDGLDVRAVHYDRAVVGARWRPRHCSKRNGSIGHRALVVRPLPHKLRARSSFPDF